MNIEKAAKILEDHNKWRRDKNVPSELEMADPTELGIAIDTVVKFFRENV